MDESLLGPWNTYQREQEGDVRGEEEGGCVHFTRKDGKTSKERQRKGEERGTQEISRVWMAYKKKNYSPSIVVVPHENATTTSPLQLDRIVRSTSFEIDREIMQKCG